MLTTTMLEVFEREAFTGRFSLRKGILLSAVNRIEYTVKEYTSYILRLRDVMDVTALRTMLEASAANRRRFSFALSRLRLDFSGCALREARTVSQSHSRQERQVH